MSTGSTEVPLKLSARNVIKGKVVDVKSGLINARILVDIGGGNVISSVVTAEAVADLELVEGVEVSVVIKSSSVMLAR
jgi:molybdopterin-binding protein